MRSRVLAHSVFANFEFTDNPLVGADFWTARLTAVRVIGDYIGLLVWPSRLSADYSYNQIPLFTWQFRSAGDWKTVASVVLCVALAGFALACIRRHRAIFFFVFLFFGVLAPTSNLLLTIGTIMAERFLYVPALAFACCLVIAVHAAGEHRAAHAFLAVVCIALAARTFSRNFDWASEQTLQASAAEAAPDSFRAHMALAALLAGSGEAVAEADRTRAILDPLPDERNSMRAYWSTGIGYRLHGDRAAAAGGAAAPWYRKSLETLLRARAIEQAHDRMNRLENQRRGRPPANFGWYPVYLELGRTYLRLEQPREALDVFRHGRALALRPEFFEEMSAAYSALGDPTAAAITLFEGLVVDTTQTRFGAQLSELYNRIDPRSCAVSTEAGVKSLNMECPLVKSHFCAALRNAVHLYREAGAADTAARTASLADSQYACPAANAN